MSEPMSDDDFMHLLRTDLDADLGDVPPELSAFAEAAGEWLVIDEVLAALDEPAAAASLRATADAQESLSFSAPPYAVLVSRESGVLVGEVTPAPYPDVEVQTPESTSPVELDERGRFRVAGVEGPFRLRLRRGAQRITTPWVIR